MKKPSARGPNPRPTPRRKTRAVKPDAAPAAEELFHMLLHAIDPSNHGRIEGRDRDGRPVTGFWCLTGPSPYAAGERVYVLFGPGGCEVHQTLFGCDRFIDPVPRYACEDPDLLQKLFRRLDALNVRTPAGFEAVVRETQARLSAWL